MLFLDGILFLKLFSRFYALSLSNVLSQPQALSQVFSQGHNFLKYVLLALTTTNADAQTTTTSDAQTTTASDEQATPSLNPETILNT